MAFPAVSVAFWDVIAAVVVMQILGYLWYGPFFGKRW